MFSRVSIKAISSGIGKSITAASVRALPRNIHYSRLASLKPLQHLRPMSFPRTAHDFNLLQPSRRTISTLLTEAQEKRGPVRKAKKPRVTSIPQVTLNWHEQHSTQANKVEANKVWDLDFPISVVLLLGSLGLMVYGLPESVTEEGAEKEYQCFLVKI